MFLHSLDPERTFRRTGGHPDKQWMGSRKVVLSIDPRNVARRGPTGSRSLQFGRLGSLFHFGRLRQWLFSLIIWPPDIIDVAWLRPDRYRLIPGRRRSAPPPNVVGSLTTSDFPLLGQDRPACFVVARPADDFECEPLLLERLNVVGGAQHKFVACINPEPQSRSATLLYRHEAKGRAGRRGLSRHRQTRGERGQYVHKKYAIRHRGAFGLG